MLPHPFTQTFKLPSEIAPCKLLARKRRGPAQRSKSPGRGLGRSGSCLSMPRRTLVSLGSLGGGCPGELVGSLPSPSAITGRRNTRARRREKLGLRVPDSGPNSRRGPVVTAGRGLGSGSHRVGVQQANKGIVC